MLQAEIYGVLTWSSSTHHTSIVWPHYLAKQTLLLISVLNVLFYWLNVSLDSIKNDVRLLKSSCNARCVRRPPFLITASRRRRHSLIRIQAILGFPFRITERLVLQLELRTMLRLTQHQDSNYKSTDRFNLCIRMSRLPRFHSFFVHN